MTVPTAPPTPTTTTTTTGSASPRTTLPPRRPDRPAPRRTRPVIWTPADVGLTALCAVSAVLGERLTFGVLSSGPGWFFDLVVAFALFLGLVYLTASEQHGHLAALDRVATMVIVSGAVALLVPLISLVLYVFSRGLPNLSVGHFFTQDLSSVAPDAPARDGGGAHAVLGTLEQAGLALVFVLPLGVLTAVFLNETRSRLRRPVRIVVDAMSGLPSIVAGLFIYAAFIVGSIAPKISSFSGTMAALALSLVMLPTVTRTVEVVLRLVPDGLREASLALGASRARTVWSVVLPTARSGVITAVVLGLARIVGETAPLLFTAFGSSLINANPFSGPQESLPLFVFRSVKSASQAQADRGFAGAVVLILLVLALFTLARWSGRPRKAKAPRRRVEPQPLPGKAPAA